MTDEFDIILNVRGSRAYGGEEDTLELMTEGRLFEQGGGKYAIEYQESELPGLPSTTMRVSVDGDAISMGRVGGQDMDFVFQKSKRHEACYTTPMGLMRVMVLPTRVTSEQLNGRGSIGIEYVIEYGEMSALNRLYIDYQLKN